MRRKVSVLSGALVACALFAGLSGCDVRDSGQSSMDESADSAGTAMMSTSGSEQSSAQEPVTMSEAFATAGLWYGSDETPSADVPVQALFVFDGKGNVTSYIVNGAFTYGDVDNLSDEEVINRAKRADKKYINEWKETEEAYLLMQDEEEFSEKYGQSLSGVLDSLENLEYKAPQPMPFKLFRKTLEEGGDDVTGEEITVQQDTIVYEWESANYATYTTRTIFLSFDAEDNTEVFSVGSKYFGGYGREDGWGLYTKVSKNHGGFLFDGDKSIPEVPRLPNVCGTESSCTS